MSHKNPHLLSSTNYKNEESGISSNSANFSSLRSPDILSVLAPRLGLICSEELGSSRFHFCAACPLNEVANLPNNLQERGEGQLGVAAVTICLVGLEVLTTKKCYKVKREKEWNMVTKNTLWSQS